MKIIIIILLLVISGGDYGQKIVLSEQLPKHQNIIFMGEDSLGIHFVWEKYNLMGEAAGKGVMTLNKDMTLKFDTPINPQYKNKTMRMISIRRHKNQWLVFAAYWNTKLLKDFLFCRPYSDNGKPLGQWKYMTETYCETSDNYPDYELVSSEKGNHLSVCIIEKQDKNNFIFNIHVFDGKMNNMYQRRVIEKGHFNDYLISGLQINSRGEVFVLIRQTVSIEALRGALFHRKKFILMKFSNYSDAGFIRLIKTKSDYVNSVTIRWFSSKGLFLGGYYSHYGPAVSNGSFIMKLEGDSINILHKTEFTNAILDSFPLTQWMQSYYKNGMQVLTAKALEMGNNGSIYLMGESVTQYFNYIYQKKGKPDYWELTPENFYSIGDVLVQKWDSAKTLSYTILNKKKIATSESANSLSPWPSFGYSFDGSTFVFIFNKSTLRTNPYSWSRKDKTSFVKLDSAMKKSKPQELSGSIFIYPQGNYPYHFGEDIYLGIAVKKRDIRVVKWTSLN